MNRRKFLAVSAASFGGLLAAGTAYRFFRPSDPLDSFYKSTRKVLSARLGERRADDMMRNIRNEYAGLVPSVPDIGGKQSMFTEWLDYGVYYLAVYRVLKRDGYPIDQAGELIFRTYETMADYPKGFLNLVGRLKYGNRYVSRLRQEAGASRQRRYPAGWVAEFIDGDGREFDYGLNITECGICKFYKAHNAMELAPYMCLSDYVVSRAFDRGLVRQYTIAEGHDHCDFRYKTGRETFVYPLRKGWPPQFANVLKA
ncbi:MAG: L-2-amino-thiazoline-4-carboxylic acid hydrolase [Deltaproteobacteria bacterium]|nr:L-2-amino-thiazoline-4-carboxylic acid hydrolase [Deltaproteobacteria bacterium]